MGTRAQYFVSLKSKKDIDILFKKGGKLFGKSLMLRYARTPAGSEPPFRVVFAVAAKLGDATRRNRIKRRLREALFAILKAGAAGGGPGFDLAILPRVEVADLPFTALCDELRLALQKLPKK